MIMSKVGLATPLLQMFLEDNYHPHPLPKQAPMLSNGREPQPRAEFQSATTYGDEYRAKALPATDGTAAHVPYCKPDIAFEGVSSYQDAYQAHAISPPPLCLQPAVRPHVPFQGSSTTQDTYVPHVLPPREVALLVSTLVHRPCLARWCSSKPVSTLSPGNLARSFGTCPLDRKEAPIHDYRHATTCTPYEPAPQACRVATGIVQDVTRPRYCLDSETTYTTAFVSHPLTPREQMAPETPARQHVPFSSDTTYKSDYIPKALHSRAEVAAHGFERPVLPFEGSSAYTDSFVCHPISPPVQPRAPMPRPRVAFEGESTSHAVHSPKPVQARTGTSVLARCFDSPPFDGTTTMKTDFQRWQLEARPEPSPPPLRAQLPLEGTTTHADAFKGWQLPPSFPGIGLELVGDRMHHLVPKGAQLPCAGRQLAPVARSSHLQIFTTVHDNQSELCILVYSGDSPVASQNRLIGQFDLTNIPPSPARVPQIEVTFAVDANGVLKAVARDLHSNRQHQWLQDESLRVTFSEGAQPHVTEDTSHHSSLSHGAHAKRTTPTVHHPCAAAGIARGQDEHV